MTMSPQRLEQAYQTARAALLRERGLRPYWTGALSPSALATATAISALCQIDRATHAARIAHGLTWLLRTQNPDGGWGDTPRSKSNLSTTWLVRAALALTQAAEQPVLARCEAYLQAQGGIDAVLARYGEDKTFSAPILTNLAIAGLSDWRRCPPLPFWLAALPRRLYPFLGLRVVSYALPALIAVGLAGYRRRKQRGWFGKLAARRALKVLEQITPESGGYLEATPLTSFVAMSLVAAGERQHPVLVHTTRFLCSEQAEDGSWKIDRDLAIWVTTGSICALGEGDAATRDWILQQQSQGVHRFVGSAPGAWGWTNSSGSVPDADDTSGAVLALRLLSVGEATSAAAARGITWLVGLQNSDGGWPTFCRGWQKLPFDRSCPDITAHALRAMAAWAPVFASSDLRTSLAYEKGFAYLRQTQRADGSWLPLWFGNEQAPQDENPVLGTARVLLAYRDEHATGRTPATLGAKYLCRVQNTDGSWGGAAAVAGSIEETALACEALCAFDAPESVAACTRGLEWLCDRIDAGEWVVAAPLGLYFAKLWYYERLYPLIFAVSALRRARYGVGKSQSHSAMKTAAQA